MPSSQEQYTQIDYLPNLHDIIMTVWRHRTSMMITIVAISILGALLILLKTDTYNASTTIMVKDNSVNLQDFKEFTDTPKFDAMTILTEVKVLMSPTLALKTIEATKLYETDEFKSSTGDAKGSLPKFMKSLKVSQQGVSKIIEISFESTDPELAAKVANEHVNSYFMSQIDNKTKRVSDLSNWFQGRVKILKEDVVQKSRAASAYRSANKLVVGQDDQELIYEQINEASAKIGTTQTAKLDIDSKLTAIEALKDTADSDSIAAIVNSGLIQNFKSAVNAASQEAALLRGKYGDRHPAVIAANSKLGQARSSLRDETRKIKETLKSDSLAAQVEIDMLKSHVAQLEKDASNMREKAIIFEGLRLEEKTSQKLLDSFLASYEGLQSQDNIARSDAIVVSSAVAPSMPSGPSMKVLFLTVIIFSSVVGLAVVFILEVMRSGIRNFEDIRKFGYKPLGIMPDVPSPIYVASSPQNSGYKEALKRIYMTGLLSAEGQSILVTSALPKEGRTTFTMSMAHYMRSIGHSVLVIDADFMNPAISFSEGNVKAAGFTDYLAGQVELSDIITKNDAGLYIIKAGRQQLPSPDILRSDRFSNMMEELKKQYGFILIDSSPILAHAESEVIAGKVDGVIVVTEWMKTSHPNVANVAITLGQVNAHVIGLAINRVDIERYKSYTTGSDFLLPNMTRADFS